MAITSEIIGKLGGADVETVPVEGVASGGAGSEVVMHTVTVPAGETWLVAAIGQMIAGNSGSTQRPDLHLGDVKITRSPSGKHGLATVATESISFTIDRNTPSGTDTFTGHVYTVKL